jgi:hypothetical protein
MKETGGEMGESEEEGTWGSLMLVKQRSKTMVEGCDYARESWKVEEEMMYLLRYPMSTANVKSHNLETILALVYPCRRETRILFPIPKSNSSAARMCWCRARVSRCTAR